VLNADGKSPLTLKQWAALAPNIADILDDLIELHLEAEAEVDDWEGYTIKRMAFCEILLCTTLHN
jgi:hypothetical protein